MQAVAHTAPVDVQAQPGNADRGHPTGGYVLGLGLIALTGFGIRVAHVLATAEGTSFDGAYYHFAANVLAEGGGFVNPWNGAPTALHPPAWPAVLALPSVLGLDTLLAHQLFACLVGAATVVLVGYAGRLIAGTRVGLIAAGITAVYPNLWVRERELAAETLVFPLVAIVLVLACRYWVDPRAITFAALGAACGALALVRAEQALLLALLLPPLALRARSASPTRRRVLHLVAGIGVALVVLLPWVVHNTVRFERPVLLTTSLGVNLRAGNCPAAYYGERVGFYDPDIWSFGGADAASECPSEVPGTDEAAQDVEYRDVALDYMREHAARVPAVVAAREGRTWGVFRPLQQSRFEQEWGGGPLGVYHAGLVSYWVLVPFAMSGFRRLGGSTTPRFALLSFLVIVVAATAVTFGQFRFRASAEVSIIVLAAVGLDAVWTRLRTAVPAPDAPQAPNAAKKDSTTSSASVRVRSV